MDDETFWVVLLLIYPLLLLNKSAVIYSVAEKEVLKLTGGILILTV